MFKKPFQVLGAHHSHSHSLWLRFRLRSGSGSGSTRLRLRLLRLDSVRAATSKVKGSELKKIKAKLTKAYEITEEQLEELLPKDVGKLQLDNKSYLFASTDMVPVLIDVEGRGDIIPTLFTCWRYPKMAASISIFAPVSPFVCKKGADVMLPGCSPENLGSFRKGDMRALLVADPKDASRVNPMPIAVGEMDLASDDDHGMKGRAMRVLHYYGDEVWSFGGGSLGSPNPGFKEGEVDVYEGEWGEEAQQQAEAARAERLDKMDEGGDGEFGKKKKKKDKKKKDKDDETEEERRERKEKKAAKKKKKEAEAAAAAGGSAEPEPEPEGHGMSMDEMIEYCFAAGVVVSLSDDELPMPLAAFYSSHMIKHAPDGMPPHPSPWLSPTPAL